MEAPKEFGQAAEAAAERYFRQQGYRILDKNVRVGKGELDLVVSQGDTIVFVEVKARRTREFGGAVHAIDQRKQQQLIRLAALYRAKHHFTQRNCRFDVIVYQGGLDPAFPLEHIENAFEVDGEDLRW